MVLSLKITCIQSVNLDPLRVFSVMAILSNHELPMCKEGKKAYKAYDHLHPPPAFGSYPRHMIFNLPLPVGSLAPVDHVVLVTPASSSEAYIVAEPRAWHSASLKNAKQPNRS
jgi:hypothetical protein